ncbi:lytic transglycosylase [Polymorphobacter glacialis]|uniref:Lytic transglycosylase n=1 Tax=Sandarakinorhabdus glacialis TaxID=1614636 RepID=A0A916ZMK7_9SPHN|nr:transglycosylase SLT domain-containing protein [Polymorphobacter glacialis]GGE05057.1 lytic transglycosylase [Polymorphobacter glacialis]
MASNVFSRALPLAALLLSAAPVLAQLSPASRSLYTARLANNAAGQFSSFAASPLVGAASDNAMDAVVTWDRLRRTNYTKANGATFGEYARFLKERPDWPQSVTLRRAAEKLIDDTILPADRITYFKQFPPMSALAKLWLAEAYLQSGRSADAREMARDAWDSAGLDPMQEITLLAQFERDLRPEDHLSRADRLLWSGQTSAAGRLLPRMDQARQQWLLARIALRTNSPDAASRLANVPAALANDPGLILDRALYMRRRGDVASAQALLANANPSPGNVLDPETWLKTRLEFARAAWRSGNPEAAYRIASRHSAYPDARSVAERSLGERQAYVDSEWLAGWLALRKLGRPQQAVANFQNARTASLTPLSQSRGDYWIGRSYEAAGKANDARAAYEAAAVHFDYFYGQLAAERLGKPLSVIRARQAVIPGDEASTFRADPLVRATFALGDLGDRGRQAIFLRQLADRAKGPRQMALVAGLAGPLNRQDLGVFAGKAARAEGDFGLLDSAFPVLPLPGNLRRDFTMIHAITRQESQFDRTITSSANAQGLMQLLPGTAAEQAGKMGLPSSTERLTSDPIYNVTLGSGYFNRLKDNLAGSHVLAVAGYNAGPGNVRKFLAANGDPRTSEDVIDWIEAIPLSETRNYVQRVLENAVVYDMLNPQTAIMPTTNRLSAYLGKRTPG